MKVRLLACLLALGCSKPEPPPAPKPRAATPVKPVKPVKPVSTARQVDDFFKARETLDKSLWSPEALAQDHERTIVALWDELRESPNPDAVLAAFPVAALVTGPLGPAAPVLPQLRRRRWRRRQPRRG